MNFTNEELISRLKENYEYISSIYGEDAILGIFIENEKTFTMRAIVIPSLEELCFEKIGGLIYKDGDVIIMEDICSFATLKSSYGILFAKSKVLNKKYTDLIENLLQCKEDEEKIKAVAINFIKRRIESNEDIQLNLTPSEEEAFNELCKRIGREGIVSVSSLSKDTMISRPVYNSLINKLEKAKAVVIKNVGARGTYIKIINKKLIQERGI